jgi:cysteine desulfuration protein SufE
MLRQSHVPSAGRMADGMEQAPTIAEEQARLREEFELLDDPRDKYEYIIDLGRELAGLPEAAKVEANRVRGCQSQVWMVADYDPAARLIRLRADSDAIISKGLVALVLRLYGDRAPEEILDNPPEVFEQIGLGRLVTPGRSNGLYSMVNRVRQFAEGFSAVRPA